MTGQVFGTVTEGSTTQQTEAETSKASKASFSLRGHNPDVLTCIANLSSDEVFTPPELANEMLDVLEEAWAESNAGANIWADPSVTFLDPFTKSGVFLREIVARLTDGLQHAFPDLQQRVDHILTKQVFGIGITRLTALLARRTVYCSKFANGKHSITDKFDDEDGNIWFERTEHTWTKRKREQRVHPTSGVTEMVELEGTGRCKFCGANEANYSRDSQLETHAYAFIHTDDIKARIAELFGANMQFDVIIGNPPYQLEDGGASASARPIYHLFVDQAQELAPRYVVMITPSRWFSGGKGLDTFRKRMLSQRRLRSITDFIVADDAFPGVNVNGGVSYFLWDRDHSGPTIFTSISPGGLRGESALRRLDEFDILVRKNEAADILQKILRRQDPSFSRRVSARKPFGLPTNFSGRDSKSQESNIKVYGSGKIWWVSEEQICVNKPWINRWKVLVARASDGNEKYPLPIWDSAGPFMAAPGEACTETYLVASIVDTYEEGANLIAYMQTKFFRFLVSTRKITQDNKADIFGYVPDLPLDRVWTDSELYRRYELTDSEIEFIDSQIRTMDYADE